MRGRRTDRSVTAGFRFRNNLVVATGGLPLVDVVAGQSGNSYQGNDYWADRGPFSIVYAGATYGSIGAFRRGAGREVLGGVPVGRAVDPLLVDAGGAGTLGDADALERLAAYHLRQGSAVARAGLDLQALFGIDPGGRDDYAHRLPAGVPLDIGAHQSTGASREGIGRDVHG
jgi:hypothetical protein